MPTQIIPAFSKKETPTDLSRPYLSVAEAFQNTIQGENFVGVPSVFLRLKNCSLNCRWCDSSEVWRTGNKWNVEELFELFEKAGAVNLLLNKKHHLILTGGSPLKQQEALCAFILLFYNKYGQKPFIEVENECVLAPIQQLAFFVDIWNNSPKLANSGMRKEVRYKPEIIKMMSRERNNYFKFVVSSEADWDEIEEDFLKPDLIRREQIVLMPEGQTQEELHKTRVMTAELAIRESVRFSDRLHITLYNKKTGV